MASRSLKNIHRMIEEATNELPPEKSFVADLQTAIERRHAENRRTSSRSYKPSSMQCVRNMYFTVTGADKDPESTTSELVGILEVGTFRHDVLQKSVEGMKALGMDCEYVDVEKFIKSRKIKGLKVISKQGMETKLFHEELNISFLCDGIIKYKGQYYILEIKTETSNKFWKREGIDEKHIPQGSAYCALFNLGKVMFLYECRDNSAKKAYILEVTDEMKFDHVISKIEVSDAHVKKMIPPPIPLDITKTICQYCPYKGLCRKVGKD